MKLNTPKQYLKLAGRAVIEHTLDSLDRSGLFAGIVLVADESNVDGLGEALSHKKLDSELVIVAGGETRNESAYKGLQAISDPEANVLIHDAVRPFIDTATPDTSIGSPCPVARSSSPAGN